MYSVIQFNPRVLLAVTLAGIFFTGCVYDPYDQSPPRHGQYYYDPYDYYYYPGVRVYFHFSTGYYFYFHHNRWIRSRTLPPHIHLHPRDRVRMNIKSDKPYLKYREHHKQYRPKPHPDVRGDQNSSKKEREANRRKYEEYEQERGRRSKKSKYKQDER